MGNSGRCRHAAQGAETSGGGCQVVGVGDIQVDGTSLWERRWVAGATARCYDNKRLLMGGGGGVMRRR